MEASQSNMFWIFLGTSKSFSTFKFKETITRIWGEYEKKNAWRVGEKRDTTQEKQLKPTLLLFLYCIELSTYMVLSFYLRAKRKTELKRTLVSLKVKYIHLLRNLSLGYKKVSWGWALKNLLWKTLWVSLVKTWVIGELRNLLVCVLVKPLSCR